MHVLLFTGLVLVAAGALLLIFAGASGQSLPPTRPTGPVPTHSTVPCNELAEYSQIYRNCDTYTNCSGTQCHLMQQLTGSTAKLWVEENCADPVMVDLSVDGPENSFLNGYRGQFRVGGDGLGVHDPNTVSANFGRNASHLTFRVCRVLFTYQKDGVSYMYARHMPTTYLVLVYINMIQGAILVLYYMYCCKAKSM